MNKLARIGAFAILPLLAGCFDARQDIVIDSNGTATMTLEVALAPVDDILAMLIPPDELAAMPPAQKDAIAAQVAAQQDDELCAPDPEDVPDGFTVTVETYVRDDGYNACRATMVGPIEKLGQALADQAGTDGPTTELVDEGGGVYAFRFYLPIPATPDQTIDADTLAMMAALTEGRSFVISITAPRIIETSGVLEGNTATLEIPAIALLTAPEQEYDFTVRFALR
jgi:hypothetical protein